MNGPIGLVNCCVRIGTGGSIGIRDRDSSKLLSPDHARVLFGRPLSIKQGIVFVGVSVRPTIHRDCGDIAGGIEAYWREHAIQLLTDIPLKIRKGSANQFVSAHPVLLAAGQARFTWSPQHEEHHGLVRFAGELVRAQADGKVEHRETVITPRRNDLSYAQFVERCPIANGYVGVNEWFLDAVVQRLLLLLSQLWTEIWNHAVVAGKNATFSRYLLQFP